jgi:adenylosuccinate synthase
MPYTPDLDRVEPVYETWPGWQTPTTDCRTWESLPAPARAYLQRVAELTGVQMRYISVGPQRDAMIVVQ